MRRVAAPLVALTLLGAAQPAAKSPQMALWRLDCGRILNEEHAGHSPWQANTMPIACYLVRHGDRYMLWDAGLSRRALGDAHPTLKLDRTISDQLATIGVKPQQVAFVGISHYHGDHTGQAAQFPQATLLIGVGDLEALKQTPPPGGAAPTHIAPWLSGTSKVEALVEDRDVFGDGRVTVLMTPGHTPGHSSLLVKLDGGKNVILSGDLWATHENVLRGTMPPFNSSRAETLASRDRISRLAEKIDATVVLQHEPADIAKLPAFPKAAE
jgi:glyoxylase-like metal-dependent hydrolase (beta-lactamase superfamily II)